MSEDMVCLDDVVWEYADAALCMLNFKILEEFAISVLIGCAQ